MQTIEDSVFQNLYMAKQLADSGFLEPFLQRCGNQDLDDEDYYGLAWDAISCVFPNVAGYYNQEIEVDAIVIFDPLIDELCRLLAQYEIVCGITPGESDLRYEVNRDIYRNFDFSNFAYDYDFRIYDTEHGRKRLVVLMGMEFCGFRELPGALADVRCALEYQVQRLRGELGLEPRKENDVRKEAA